MYVSFKSFVVQNNLINVKCVGSVPVTVSNYRNLNFINRKKKDECCCFLTFSK